MCICVMLFIIDNFNNFDQRFHKKKHLLQQYVTRYIYINMKSQIYGNCRFHKISNAVAKLVY
jgi:hypothetical protein